MADLMDDDVEPRERVPMKPGMRGQAPAEPGDQKLMALISVLTQKFGREGLMQLLSSLAMTGGNQPPNVQMQPPQGGPPMPPQAPQGGMGLMG